MSSLTKRNIKMCCVKIITQLTISPKIRLPLSQCVCVDLCPKPAWHAARAKHKNVHGLKSAQDKQQQRPQPHDNWVRHALYYSEQGWTHSSGCWAQWWRNILA